MDGVETWLSEASVCRGQKREKMLMKGREKEAAEGTGYRIQLLFPYGMRTWRGQVVFLFLSVLDACPGF